MAAQIDKSTLFRNAWGYARTLAASAGTGPRAQFGRALREAYAATRQPAPAPVKEAPRMPGHFYLVDRSGYGSFPLRVLERFESREALLARMSEVAVETNDYDEGLNFLSSATHVAWSELRINVGKCIPGDRCKASDLRTGPGGPEALPIMRAFAARIDRLQASSFPEFSDEEREELDREARQAIAQMAREPRARHGWR